MKLSRTTTGVLVAGLLTVTAGSIWAGQRQAGPRAGMRMGFPMGPGLFLSQLGLSDAQRQQIRAIVQRHRTEIQPLMLRARASRVELRAAETADPFDDNAIRAKAGEVAAIQADLAVARAHLQADLFQVLTPDQQQKVRERRAQRPGRRQQAPGL
jgi:Spy/CpxP family protein refolding chaperone